MIVLKNTFRLVLFLLLLNSCSPEDPYPERESISLINTIIVDSNVGGPNQPNQVYFDFGSNTQTEIQRDSWDLRFYCKDEFRVSLNTSVYMATKSLDVTDINAVNTVSVQNLFNTVTVGTFEANNVEYVDDFDGDIFNTAISEISEIDSENKIYLLNLGYAVGTDIPQIGSTTVTGDHRGWKKIRILKQNDKYLLQYADLDDTTFQEAIIEKDNNYNFTFFSFNTNTIVDVEPEKKNWDICFTVFTNEFPGFGTYGFTDFISSNNLQNVMSYSVSIDDFNFDDFLQTDIVEENFIPSQTAIGSSWRIGGGPGSAPQTTNDFFFILKDTKGFTFKLKFSTLTNTEGERGFPQFKYEIVDIQ